MADEATTIQLSRDTKQRLDKRKLDGESYDDALRRVLDDAGVLFDEAEIRAIARDVVDDELDKARAGRSL